MGLQTGEYLAIRPHVQSDTTCSSPEENISTANCARSTDYICTYICRYLEREHFSGSLEYSSTAVPEKMLSHSAAESRSKFLLFDAKSFVFQIKCRETSVLHLHSSWASLGDDAPGTYAGRWVQEPAWCKANTHQSATILLNSFCAAVAKPPRQANGVTCEPNSYKPKLAFFQPVPNSRPTSTLPIRCRDKIC